MNAVPGQKKGETRAVLGAQRRPRTASSVRRSPGLRLIPSSNPFNVPQPSMSHMAVQVDECSMNDPASLPIGVLQGRESIGGAFELEWAVGPTTMGGAHSSFLRRSEWGS